MDGVVQLQRALRPGLAETLAHLHQPRAPQRGSLLRGHVRAENHLHLPLPRGRELGGVERVVGVQPRVRAPEDTLKTQKNCRPLFGIHVMNPFWSMSTGSVRKRSDTEDKTLSGELRTSPLRASAKKQLPSIPKNAVPITKPASPATSSQSTNGTHASYGPFYLEYSLLAEL